MSIVKGIEQELTRKLILNPKWYLKMNVLSLLDYDLSTISSVFTAFGDRGWVNGNEAHNGNNIMPLPDWQKLKRLDIINC